MTFNSDIQDVEKLSGEEREQAFKELIRKIQRSSLSNTSQRPEPAQLDDVE